MRFGSIESVRFPKVTVPPTNDGDEMSMTPKAATYALYALAVILLGALAGAFCWVFFFLMDNGIELLWDALPSAIAADAWWWPLPMCLVGGLAVGLFQKRWPGQPREMNEVMTEVKATGRYEYRTVFVGFAGALLPLLFGASIGPEAGLTGVIAGACTWVGDRLKFLGREFRELASVGIAAVAGAMFSAPLYGLAVPVFGDGEARESMADAKVLIPKPAKIAVYIVAIASALAAMMGLGALFGGMGGLPRFTDLNAGTREWLLLAPLALAGAVVGWTSHAAGALARACARAMGERPVAKALVAGAILGTAGCLLPYTMFAGETQAVQLEIAWTEIGAAALIATALVKPFILQFCLNLGWRGGKFFPMVFSGIALGYGLASLTGADPVFCLCVCTAGALGAMMRQPLMAALLLFLCFPAQGVVAMLAAAVVGSLIPVPKAWLPETPHAAAAAAVSETPGKPAPRN